MRLSIITLFFALLLFSVTGGLCEKREQGLQADIASYEALSAEDAIGKLAEFSSWPPEKRTAFLIGTRFLTEGTTLGSYRLYFFTYGNLSNDLVPHLTDALKSANPSVRLYTLKLLDSIRPVGLGKEIARIAAFDPDESVALSASGMLGFYGFGEFSDQFERVSKNLKASVREDMLYRFASTTSASSAQIERICADLPASSLKLAALAVSGHDGAMELAAKSEYRSALQQSWIWQVLSDRNPKVSCDLFKKHIAPFVSDNSIASFIDSLFTTAGISDPPAAYEAAMSLKSVQKLDAYIRALSYVSLAAARNDLRRAVNTDDPPLDRLQRYRYLVEIGDYDAAAELVKILKSERVAAIPRRLVWGAMMLSYLSSLDALPIMEKAYAADTKIAARCKALAPMARVAPSACVDRIAENLKLLKAEWKLGWSLGAKEEYNSTMLPSLYEAMMALTSAISELSPEKGLPLLKDLVESVEPYFVPEVLSGASYWFNDSQTNLYLRSKLSSQYIFVAQAAANILGSTGAIEDARALIAMKANPSLTIANSAAQSTAKLLLVKTDDKDRKATADRLAALFQRLEQALQNAKPVEESIEAKTGGITLDDAFFDRVTKLIAQDRQDRATIIALLRAISKKSGVRVVHLLDYSPQFVRHDITATLKGCIAARKNVK